MPRRSNKAGKLVAGIAAGMLLLTCCGGGCVPALGAVGYALVKALRNVPGPSPRPDVPAPSAELQSIVEPIKAFAGKPTSGTIAKGYRDFSWAVGRADLKTTGQLRSAIQRFEAGLFAGQAEAGSLPGFSAAANAALTKALGPDDSTLDKVKAQAALEAIAWAMGG